VNCFPKIVLCILFLVALCGCRGAFQPVSPYYMNWSKPGVEDLDIKKIILECGGYSPSGTSPEGYWKSENEMALSHYCIINSGYTYMNPFRGGRADNNSWCRNRPELPVCKSGAVIPKPSVERRLNSQYCKLRMDREYCMAFNKEREGRICGYRNFDNPPPECLP